MKINMFIACLLLLFQVSHSKAQSSDEKYATCVQSIDSIIFHLYDVISGDAGINRNWALFRHLFIAEALLIPTGVTEDGVATYKVISPDEYENKNGKYLKENGFLEKEVHRIVHQYGSIAQVFSTYETYHNGADTVPFDRGINSIELFFDQTRWWIVSIYWTSEKSGGAIPSIYLPGK